MPSTAAFSIEHLTCARFNFKIQLHTFFFSLSFLNIFLLTVQVLWTPNHTTDQQTQFWTQPFTHTCTHADTAEKLRNTFSPTVSCAYEEANNCYWAYWIIIFEDRVQLSAWQEALCSLRGENQAKWGDVWVCVYCNVIPQLIFFIARIMSYCCETVTHKISYCRKTDCTHKPHPDAIHQPSQSR